MAKKQTEETLPQKVEQAGALAVPDFIPTGSEGTDNIGKDDVQMPRLALAQKMSPQIDEEKAEYIEGLKVGQLFNSLTRTIYGKGPLRFVVVRSDKPRYIEFVPLEEGGGIRDFNVPANDPRTLFGPNGEKPIATKFYDFIVMLPDYGNEIIALSLKGTGIKTAKKLNGLIKNRVPSRPVYAPIYKLWTDSKPHAASNGTYAIYCVDNDKPNFPETQEQFQLAKHLHDSLIGKEVKIDREPGADEDTEFDTGNM